MILRTWLNTATGQLEEAGVREARLKAEWLLADHLDIGRLHLHERRDEELDPTPLAPLLARLCQHEPLQYVIGSTDFMGLSFTSDARALIPRPETELLVEWVMELAPPGGRILDVGTGTGCIAIALARLRPDLDITAVDRSAAALALARENAHALKVNIRLLESDLLAAVAGESFDLIVSNPPYIARDEMLELEPQIRSFEPETALLGGENGAELMARLVPQAFTALRASGRLVLEIGENQTKDVSELLADAGFGEIAVRPDLAGKPRMAHGLKTWPTE
ncbi:MAG: release factor glutamine methyltransferase [Candidatus Omnitrophota bacterium]|jgi:release factor glutamine methyltransferase